MRNSPLERDAHAAGATGKNTAASMGRAVAVETLELCLLPQRHGEGGGFDLTLSAVRPRAGHGSPYLDVGLLQRVPGQRLATATRIPLRRPFDLRLMAALRAGRFLRAIPQGDDGGVELSLSFSTLAHRGGVAMLQASGALVTPLGALPLGGGLLLAAERRAARRPYAWARATLHGHVDGDPIVCLLETSRGRAGSVVLPAIGRLSLFGPGARHLPRGCVLAPLPARAEYGTGQLRAAALSPGHKLELELNVPIDSTAIFEVVDPNGDAAYAHRALDADARLKLRGRKRDVVELALTGRYEWGARAGDPRVEERAWR